MLKEVKGFIAVDISGENYRTYIYPDGCEYTVERPQTLYMKESDTDSHRVTDDIGRCHYIARGWVAIIWPEEALHF